MDSNVKWICSCGGVVVGGYMYGEHFIEGDVDLNDVVRGNEDALEEIFPDGIPARGPYVEMCLRCHATRVYDN